jgi:hypothetical protein
MLEIIALIFLTKNNGNLAIQKGLKSGMWKLYTVLAWFGAEIAGVALGILMFGEEGMIPAFLLGIGAAIGSYFIIRSTLSKKPDTLTDDINRIGVEDLRP